MTFYDSEKQRMCEVRICVGDGWRWTLFFTSVNFYRLLRRFVCAFIAIPKMWVLRDCQCNRFWQLGAWSLLSITSIPKRRIRVSNGTKKKSMKKCVCVCATTWFHNYLQKFCTKRAKKNMFICMFNSIK